MRSMRSAKKDIRSCSLSGQTGVRGYSLKTNQLRTAVLETSILRVARGLCRSFCLQDPGFLEKWDLFEVFSCIDPFSGLNQGISDENGIQRPFFSSRTPPWERLNSGKERYRILIFLKQSKNNSEIKFSYTWPCSKETIPSVDKGRVCPCQLKVT